MLKDTIQEHSFTIHHVPQLMKLLDFKDKYIIYDIILADLKEIQEKLKGVNNK